MFSKRLLLAWSMALAIFSALICATAIWPQSAQAQTYKVIYNFTGGKDGEHPGGLTLDRAGNLYGTAWHGGYTGGDCGGESGCGTVFKLSNKGSGWVLNPLYNFTGGNDGAYPTARVIFGPDGSLYGTTTEGGDDDFGLVFNLRPPATACKTVLCFWTETVLYAFTGGNDGAAPGTGALIFDHAGNIYGTASGRGSGGWGNVYELVRSNDGWTLNVVYGFTGGSDGGDPTSGVIFDNSGNLYGVTTERGDLGCGLGVGCGTAFQLTPSGPGWIENVLYTFLDGSDGAYPFGGLIFDQSHNLYGTTCCGGSGGGGTVFMLTPSEGGWTFTLLYGFAGSGGGPTASLIMDNSGNLYGTTQSGGAHGAGSVFELTPGNSGWTYTSLHDFTGGSTDGGNPRAGVVLDANGNLYGTAPYGGKFGCEQDRGCGVVWEVTP